jgi:hypothetical protein
MMIQECGSGVAVNIKSDMSQWLWQSNHKICSQPTEICSPCYLKAGNQRNTPNIKKKKKRGGNVKFEGVFIISPKFNPALIMDAKWMGKHKAKIFKTEGMAYHLQNINKSGSDSENAHYSLQIFPVHLIGKALAMNRNFIS